MKKRLTGKPACVAVLTALIIISVAEVVLRSAILSFDAININNVGEPFITVLFSVMLIIFARKGKDRLFYILCGAWLGYFVLHQLFGLPAMIANFVSMFNLTGGINAATIMILLHALSMICIVAIGGLLVEYMNDGSIYNKAFNTLCIITVLMAVVHLIIGIIDLALGAPTDIIFAVLNNLSRMAMVFLFVYFAYDSAKKQLAKTKL